MIAKKIWIPEFSVFFIVFLIILLKNNESKKSNILIKKNDPIKNFKYKIFYLYFVVYFYQIFT